MFKFKLDLSLDYLKLKQELSNEILNHTWNLQSWSLDEDWHQWWSTEVVQYKQKYEVLKQKYLVGLWEHCDKEGNIVLYVEQDYWQKALLNFIVTEDEVYNTCTVYKLDGVKFPLPSLRSVYSPLAKIQHGIIKDIISVLKNQIKNQGITLPDLDGHELTDTLFPGEAIVFVEASKSALKRYINKNNIEKVDGEKYRVLDLLPFKGKTRPYNQERKKRST